MKRKAKGVRARSFCPNRIVKKEEKRKNNKTIDEKQCHWRKKCQYSANKQTKPIPALISSFYALIKLDFHKKNKLEKNYVLLKSMLANIFSLCPDVYVGSTFFARRICKSILSFNRIKRSV